MTDKELEIKFITYWLGVINSGMYKDLLTFEERLRLSRTALENKVAREPYPPPSHIMQENGIEIKQCIHCEHSYKPPNVGRSSQWVCNHPDFLEVHTNLVSGDTHAYTSCESARSSGFLGLFKGKCGPEAKYYEVRKFKDKPTPPGKD